eukprot:m.184509 g.184509  ORF g.184509 m.184509 type:complete len:445 (+) comp32194_c0_seq3:384-1718(+)
MKHGSSIHYALPGLRTTNATCACFLSLIFATPTLANHVYPAKVNFAKENNTSNATGILNGSVYPGSAKNVVASAKGVLITGPCETLLAQTTTLAQSRNEDWVAVFTASCHSYVFLQVGNLAITVTNNKLKGVVMQDHAWKKTWGSVWTSENENITIPIVLMDEIEIFKAVMSGVNESSRFTVAITMVSTDDPSPAESTSYARTAVFVCFCIMSFCIMSMYCRIKLSVMRENDMRNAIWLMALADSVTQEDVQRRSEIVATVVASMPSRTITAKESAEGVGEDKDCCVICLDNYVEGDVVAILPCSHEFHKECIDPWLIERFTCPLCKYDILKEALTDADHVDGQVTAVRSDPGVVVVFADGAPTSSTSDNDESSNSPTTNNNINNHINTTTTNSNNNSNSSTSITVHPTSSSEVAVSRFAVPTVESESSFGFLPGFADESEDEF